jgi:hypothetical protein
MSFMQFKQLIQNETMVLTQNQKIIGIKKNNVNVDDFPIFDIMDLLPKPKKDGSYEIKLFGNPEQNIRNLPQIVPTILDDFDLDFWPTEDQIQDYMSRMENLDRVTEKVGK